MAGSPARKEVSRVGVKVVPDTSDFGRELKAELSRWSNEKIDIEINADLASFEAELNKATTDRKVSVEIDLDTAQAEAQLQTFLRDRKVSVQLDLDTANAASRINSLTRASTKKININVDTAAAQAKIAALTKTETKTVKVDIDKNNLASATSGINQVASRSMSLFESFGRVVSNVVTGVFQLGQTAAGVFDGMRTGSQTLVTALGIVAAGVLGILTSVVQLGAMVGVIAAVAGLLGSVVTAAGAATLALGAVVIGAGALIALPLIFAGIAYSFMQSSKDLQAEWSDLTSAFQEAFKTSLQPMLEQIGILATKAGKALKEGHPAWDAWNRAVAAASQAIGPLASGFGAFVTTALGGMATALENLNANGFWQGIETGLATLGEAVGTFFVELSTWGPEIASGFQGLADGMLTLLPAFAGLVGAFSSFAPSVIEGIAEAFARLFDAFSANRDVYASAAQAFADALVQMAPSLELVFRAFAQMAPDVMGSLALAVQQFAEALSNPDTVAGLTALTVGLIEFSAAALTAATDFAAYMGNAASATAEFGELITGKLKATADVSTEHLRGLVEQADSTKEAADNLSAQLQLMFGEAIRTAVGDMRELRTMWQNTIDHLAETGRTGSAKINTAFREQFLGLLNTIDFTGTELNAEWAASMQKLIDETARSGDPLAATMSQHMQRILDTLKAKGPEAVAQVQTMLQGMDDQAKASQIAELMGIEMDKTSQSVADGVTKAQQSFQRLPEVMRDIINSSKTPEELDSKLSAMNQIIGQRAGEGAQEFAKLPEGMAKAVATDTISTQVSTIMGKVKQTIATGVVDAKQSFSELPKALSGLVLSDTTIQTSVQSQMTRVKGTVVTGVNDIVTAWKKLFTDMSAAAKADQTPAAVEQNMKKILETIKDAVTKGIAEVKRLADQAANHGKLTGFLSAIQSAMNTAKQTVSTAVNQIITSLNSLNRSFQGPTITVTTVNQTQESSGDDFSSFSAPPPPSPMAMMLAPEEPVSMMAMSSGLDTLTTQSQALTAYADALRSSGGSNKEEVGGVTKIYSFEVNAAPNVPTEEQLRKQLSYADALYE